MEDDLNEPREDRSTSFTLTLTLVLMAILVVLAFVLKKGAAPRERPSPAAEPAAETAEAPTAEAGGPRIPVGSDGKPLSDYQILTSSRGGCSLVEDAGNGGDTFRATTPEGTHRFRLYWARTVAVNDGDPRTARDMIDHFSLPDEDRLRQIAKEAGDFTLNLLRLRPFRIITRWEKEPDDDAFLCFVYIDDGEGGWRNLSTLLVQNGLALIEPCDRPVPEPRVSAGDYQNELTKAEDEARQTKSGAWAR